MIDTTKLLSSSKFAGFANLPTKLGTVDIPANTLIPGHGGAPGFFMNVKRDDVQSLDLVLFQVIGPTTVDGFAYSSDQWRSSGSDFANWYQPDGYNFQIQCDTQYSADILKLRVSLVNLAFSDITYPTALTINAKAYFFRYPWE